MQKADLALKWVYMPVYTHGKSVPQHLLRDHMSPDRSVR